MATHRQDTLADLPPGSRVRVWCSYPNCGVELTDPISRQRRLGPEHDSERRSGHHPRHDVDQDPIPGT
jgi:hypothetical protein